METTILGLYHKKQINEMKFYTTNDTIWLHSFFNIECVIASTLLSSPILSNCHSSKSYIKTVLIAAVITIYAEWWPIISESADAKK